MVVHMLISLLEVASSQCYVFLDFQKLECMLPGTIKTHGLIFRGGWRDRKSQQATVGKNTKEKLRENGVTAWGFLS